MIKCVVLLLVINIYSCSLGASLVHNSLQYLLNDLSSKCGSSFLSHQIKVKIKDCDVAVPPYGEKQLQCLMFYDMSQQMCSVLSSSFDLNVTDHINYLNADQQVVKLCNSTEVWKFHNISSYPDYIVEVESILHNNVACYRLCSEDDYRSSNSNFFCKYYKWGSDILRSLEISTNEQKKLLKVSEADHNSHGPIKATNVTPSTSEASKTLVKNGEHSQDLRVLTATLKQDGVKASDNLNAQENFLGNQLNGPVGNITNQQTYLDADNESHIKKNIPEPLVNQISISSDQDKLSTIGAQVVKVANVDSSGTSSKLEHTQETSTNLELKTETEKQKSLINNLGLEEALKQPLGTGGSQLSLGKTIQQISTINSASTGQQVSEKQQLAFENPSLQDFEQSQGVIEGPDQKPQPDVGEYDADPDADDGSEPMSYETKTKEEQQLTNTKTKIDAPLSSLYGDNSQKEYAAQEQEVPEEDDHFFPFFLTAVILVILLYVFYHNKNRVLGLIVEGRQSNRRRNSRGHAYRRLDTLEQAMSGGKTATPPSKIIY